MIFASFPIIIKKIAATEQRKNPRGIEVNCSCATFVNGNADAQRNTVINANGESTDDDGDPKAFVDHQLRIFLVPEELGIHHDEGNYG